MSQENVEIVRRVFDTVGESQPEDSSDDLCGGAVSSLMFEGGSRGSAGGLLAGSSPGL